MCNLSKGVEDRGIAIGREKGREEGRENEKKATVRRLQKHRGLLYNQHPSIRPLWLCDSL